ncbi:MAG: hypothetical protein AAF570_17035, partial [Bacteroidota bacterium]
GGGVASRASSPPRRGTRVLQSAIHGLPTTRTSFSATQSVVAGEAYAGILAGKKETEYLQIAFDEALVAGRRYCLRFLATAPSFKSYALETIGMVFSEGEMEEKGWERMERENVIWPEFIGPKSAADWSLMNYSYEAKGGETHLIVGYFKAPEKIAYTFLDDFHLYEYGSEKGCGAVEFTGVIELDDDNLVPNPGFEFKYDCPTAREHLHKAMSWRIAENSPDFFHTCGSGTAAVPQNGLGHQEPHSGKGFGGFWAYLDQRQDYREFISVRLKEPLERGKQYCVSLWVSLAEVSDFVVSDMQVLFGEAKKWKPSQVDIDHRNLVFMPHDGPIAERDDGCICKKSSQQAAAKKTSPSGIFGKTTTRTSSP